jgi:hypothetical protein
MNDYLSRADVRGHLKIIELLQKWDSIGIYNSGSNAPTNEYDGYSTEIVRALDAGANAQKIAEHLGWIVRERMELPSDPIHDLKIAEEMVSFWAQWREGTDPTKT